MAIYQPKDAPPYQAVPLNTPERLLTIYEEHPDELPVLLESWQDGVDALIRHEEPPEPEFKSRSVKSVYADIFREITPRFDSFYRRKKTGKENRSHGRQADNSSEEDGDPDSDRPTVDQPSTNGEQSTQFTHSSRASDFCDVKFDPDNLSKSSLSPEIATINFRKAIDLYVQAFGTMPNKTIESVLRVASFNWRFTLDAFSRIISKATSTEVENPGGYIVTSVHELISPSNP